MTQHIRKTFLLTILFCFFLNCKFSGQEKKLFKTKENIEKENLIDGYWYCEKYEIDNRFYDPEYGTSYANEFKDNFSFTIKNDSIKVGSCKEELYTYKYNLKNSKASSESVFGIKSNSQNNIEILSTYEDKSNTCLPLDNVTMYHTNHNQIIIHEKGYFFYFSKSQEERKSSSCENEGIIGNLLNYWKLECKYSGSINEVYKNYLKKFPYSSRFLPNQVPKYSFTDSENNIVYKVKDNKIEIYKSNRVGIIYTSFEKIEGDIFMRFEMKYPEY